MQLEFDILSRIQSVIGNGFAALHEPEFSSHELSLMENCIQSGWVSSVGEYVDQFEHDLAAYVGSKRCVVTNSGTSALHIALQVAGVKRGDEVIVPALTFVATANAVAYCGAIPHFVDSEEAHFGLDVNFLRNHLSKISQIQNGLCVNKRTGAVIRAIVPMHIFGHPVAMSELKEVATEFSLIIIEDAAESLGSKLENMHTGCFGVAGILSFNGNKIITTGGGGAVVTDDEEFANRVKHLTTTAKLKHRWEFKHDEIGYNYRMPNLNAAMGCAQLEKIDDFVKKKRMLAKKYQEAFDGCQEVDFIIEREGSYSNYWLNSLVLKKADRNMLCRILDHTNNNNVMTRPAWNLVPDLHIYKQCPCSSLTIARDLVERIINIPSSPKLFKFQ